MQPRQRPHSHRGLRGARRDQPHVAGLGADELPLEMYIVSAEQVAKRRQPFLGIPVNLGYHRVVDPAAPAVQLAILQPLAIGPAIEHVGSRSRRLFDRKGFRFLGFFG